MGKIARVRGLGGVIVLDGDDTGRKTAIRKKENAKLFRYWEGRRRKLLLSRPVSHTLACKRQAPPRREKRVQTEIQG